jgi:hypothetical protein
VNVGRNDGTNQLPHNVDSRCTQPVAGLTSSAVPAKHSSACHTEIGSTFSDSARASTSS